MTQLIYNGVDITNDIDIKSCHLNDNAGGGADDAVIAFPDSDRIWGRWNPVRGDTVRINTEDYSTGLMYVDSFTQGAGTFTLQAISTPLSAKKPKNRIWRNVRLMEIAADIAKNSNLTLQAYGVIDYTYKAISQANNADIAFLNALCVREGYCCKVYDSKLIMFGEQYMESKPAVPTITPDDVYPGHDFSVADELLESFTVLYCPPGGSLISYTAMSGSAGSSGRKIELLSTIAEAERWAKGYLRSVNKNRITGWLQMKYITTVAAASVVNLSGFGVMDGKYYISKVSQDTVRNKSYLSVRRIEI